MAAEKRNNHKYSKDVVFEPIWVKKNHFVKLPK